MKKRLFAFGLALTMAFSVGILPALADELEDDVMQQEEINEYQESDILDDLLENVLPEDALDEGAIAFADDDEEVEWAWQEEPSMQVAHTRHGVQVVGDKIYVFGGGNAQRRMTSSVEIFDTVTGTWSTGTPMPTAKSDFASAVVGSKIYIMGGTINSRTTGTDYTYSSTVEIYDTETDTWTTGTSLPSLRWGGRAASVDNKIYVVAGLDEKNLTELNNTVDIYDIETDSWTSGAPMPEGMNRAYSGMAYSEGKMYIIGGWGSPDTAVYDIENDRWYTEPLTGTFNYCTATAHNNKIYVMGDDEQFYIYDIETTELTTGPRRLYTGSHARMAVVNGTLYVIGGESATVPLSNVNSIQLTDIDTPTPPPTQNRLYVLLNVAESVQLSLSHNLGVNLDYDWSSTDEAVATVNANGYVTAEGEGTCFIYAENADGYRDFIPIKVVEGNADEIRLAVHLTVGGQAKLYLAEDPGTVNWISFDSAVATVDNEGVITAHSRGLVIIQGELDGEEYHIYVRVNA